MNALLIPSRASWASDSSRVTFLYNERGHRRLRVVALDVAAPATGAASNAAAPASAAMRAVVVTSPRTADTLVSLMSVPAGAITVALPGVDDAPIAPGSSDDVLRLLCVGTVVPRKGQALLVGVSLPGQRHQS